MKTVALPRLLSIVPLGVLAADCHRRETSWDLVPNQATYIKVWDVVKAAE